MNCAEKLLEPTLHFSKSKIPAQSHTLAEIDHEIISMVILLPSPDSFKKGCCQLQARVCARNYWLTACSSLPR